MNILRKLGIIVLCTLIIMQSGFLSVSAERKTFIVPENCDELSTVLNGTELTVSGYLGGKSGYPVTVAVKESEKGTLSCLDQVMTGGNGYYRTEFPYDREMSENDYTVTVACMAEPVNYEKELTYTLSSEEMQKEKIYASVSADGMTVFGQFGGKKGYPVTVTVKESGNGLFSGIEQVLTGEEGYFKADFPYDEEMLGKSVTVTAVTPAETKSYEKSLLYSVGENEDVILAALKEVSSKKEMKSFVERYGADIGFSRAALSGAQDTDEFYTELTYQEYETLDDFRKSFQKATLAQAQKSVQVRNIYVSTEGNDSNDGSQDSPFETVEAALRYVKYLIALGSNENFEILLYGGEYKITSDIVIEKDEPNHITIKNIDGEIPILNGSKEITGWEPYSGNVYRTKIPLGLDINVLYENCEMLTKARYPNKRENSAEMPLEYLSAESYNDSKTEFMYNAGDLPEISNTEGLEVGIFAGGPAGYYMWYMNIIDVIGINKEQRLITLKNHAQYEIGTGSCYYLQGALELLDSPGEFYYENESGYIYYYPTDGKIEGKTVSYPVVDNIFKISNSDDSVISGITIDGIGICCTKRSSKVYEARDNTGGNGILIKNGKNIKVVNCEIYSVGGHAVIVGGNLWSSEFSGNYLHNAGAGGIILDEGENGKIIANIIDNNYLHSQGLIVHSRSGISLHGYNADENIISHNKVSDMKRGGIVVAYAGGVNTVEYNDVSDCVNGSDDAGPIYTMMTTGTTVIRQNYVHDTYSSGDYRGIYLDEGSHNTIVEGNLITRNGGEGYRNSILAKGNDIQIVNNYLVDNDTTDDTDKTDTDISSTMSTVPTERMVIERNIVFNGSANLYNHYFATESEQRLKSSDSNLFYNSNGVYNIAYGSRSYGLSLYRYFLGYEKNSKTENPSFISNTGADVRLSYSSSARSLGINALCLDEMGLKADFKYANSDKKVGNVFVRRADTLQNDGYIKVRVGESVNLVSVAKNADGFILSKNDVQITYKTIEQDGIVSIKNNGILTGLKEGTVRAEVTASTEEGTKVSEFDIVVSSEVEENSVAEIKSITVKKQSGDVLTGIESGKLDVFVTLKSKSDENVKMFITFTDNSSKMHDLSMSEPVSLTKDVPKEILGSITVPENISGKLTVFIWNNENALTPICGKMTLF